MVLSEALGVTAGGIIVPGYIALFLHQPVQVLSTFAVAILVLSIIKILSKVMFLYGKYTELSCGSRGDLDFFVGNLGSNNHFNISKETPVSLLIKDFDNNGSIDPILFSYSKDTNGEFKQFPVTFWNNMKTQSPLFRQKFNYYKQYARADISKIFTKTEIKGAENWPL